MPRTETTPTRICISVCPSWLRLRGFSRCEHLPRELSMKYRGSVWMRDWSAVSPSLTWGMPRAAASVTRCQFFGFPPATVPWQWLNDWKALCHKKWSAAGWLEPSPGRQEMWKVKAEFECFLHPELVSQLQWYCQIAPPLVLQKEKLMPLAAWRQMTEVVREQKREGCMNPHLTQMCPCGLSLKSQWFY